MAISHAEYLAIHRWINREYLRTGRCEWCGTTNRKTDYASVGHRYLHNRAEWFEFCRPCHKAFDGPYERTPEIRAKMSAAKKGRKASPETRAMMSAAKKGKKLPPRSPEVRTNMSAAQKGKEPWNKGRKMIKSI